MSPAGTPTKPVLFLTRMSTVPAQSDARESQPWPPLSSTLKHMERSGKVYLSSCPGQRTGGG